MNSKPMTHELPFVRESVTLDPIAPTSWQPYQAPCVEVSGLAGLHFRQKLPGVRDECLPTSLAGLAAAFR
jgi:hypothetical protein